MKILIVIDNLDFGGKERRLVELLKGLSNKNYECEIITLSKFVHYKEILEFGFKIHFIIRKIKKDPLIIFPIYKIVKSFNPDLIHCWDSMSVFYLLPSAKLNKIKIINGMITNAPKKLDSKLYSHSRLSFPFSDLIISNSYAGLKSYKAPESKSICIHNGFDFNRINTLIDKDQIKKKYNINSEKVIGMVAEFSDKKDYYTFITAAQLLLSKNNELIFLAVGDGKNLEQARNMVIESNRDKIKFLGKQQDVESIINIFDIGVLSTYTEGISNSIMEYMVLEKPVVATECDGNRELLIDNYTGLLVKEKSPEDLADKINILLENEVEYKEMGKRGKERIIENFNLNKMVQKYIETYEKLIK